MNNKGFAITGILYGLMLIFILALTSFLSILVGKNRRIDALTDSVYEKIKYETISITLLNEPKIVVVEPTSLTSDKLEIRDPINDYNIHFNSQINTPNNINKITKLSSTLIIPIDNSEGVETYTTTSKAIYNFNFNNTNRCIAYLPENVVVISGKMIDKEPNKVYYKVGGSSNLEDYLELECLNNV